MAIVATVADCLVTLLTTDAEAAAAEVGLIKRRRKVTGPRLAQTWVLGWLSKPDESRRGLACMAAAVGLVISPQGLVQRATQLGAAFLRRLLEQATQYVVCVDPAVRPVLDRFSTVMILTVASSGYLMGLSRLGPVAKARRSRHRFAGSCVRGALSCRCGLDASMIDHRRPRPNRWGKADCALRISGTSRWRD